VLSFDNKRVERNMVVVVDFCRGVSDGYGCVLSACSCVSAASGVGGPVNRIRLLSLVAIHSIAFSCLLWAYYCAGPEHGYAWTVLVAVFVGLGWLLDEHLARLGRNVAPTPRGPGECRLLVTTTWNGDIVVLYYVGDDVRVELDDAQSAFVDDIGVPNHATMVNLCVWQGHIVKTPDGGDGHKTSWDGTWRHATPAEVLRYATGKPVWGSR
jgi:hypothetical protein